MPLECPLQAGDALTGGHIDSNLAQPAGSTAQWWNTAFARGSRPAAYAALLLAATTSSRAFAQEQEQVNLFSLHTVDVVQAAVVAGVTGAALLCAVWLIRERARIAADNVLLRARVADINASLQRSEALLNLRDQRIIVWAGDKSRTEIVGVIPPETGAPEDRAGFLAFGRWLMPHSAAALEQAVQALRERAVAFDLILETQKSVPLEVQGRKTAQHVLVRFVSLSETQSRAARLELDNHRLQQEQETILGLVDTLKMPFWIRGANGALHWVNKAFAQAVEARDGAAAVRDSKEFLGAQARDAIVRQHAHASAFEQTISAVIEGDRRMFAVTDVAGSGGSAGIAIDMTAVEAIREEYERTLRSHADTLDQLTTAVATFDANSRLIFFNQAFQKLWDFETKFLTDGPDNAAVLDRLRSDGKLAEQPEWRRWQDTIMAAYRAVEPQEHWWHLPDGRTLRVIGNPQPKGGVTWVFENLTERIDLESRYNTAVRVQGETLDNLAEGVAVFGPDGRVRLANPSFSRLWGLDPDFVKPNTHVSEIRAVCDILTNDSPWREFVAAVTGFDDERRDRHGQAELKNDNILRYAIIPLPNGQVMMTFVDITDSASVQKALKEKNEALQRADQLKNDFVQHVSYELRSPLTNIIGFTELLAQPETGPLTERQRDYVGHIGSSSSVLLTIVNDILDLATVDAGIMELEIGEINVDQTVNAAAASVGERLREHAITLDLDLSRAPKTFNGDENRVRQILFNLLSNASNYAPANSAIELTCEMHDGQIQFRVHDDGPGMSPDVLDTVFRRFEPRSNGGRKRGAGLGLSIVKGFVELHGGSVRIDSATDRGTTVICQFPLVPARARAAAE
ncbi:PAS domain-containing protein [Mesorhizobium sp. NBSH29]|uniref:sensor histidine kinase n=1 Tax=Mesorhizobium sp. NBSH29 TaxID=2654249 RepID=UPI0018966F58|nr:PAS domain-containing sensor histidine kinase [Mesorhizobium sp. NBSH29]QPC86103.1 PAS domain-containing protein [Mesorhizobium sp. NBSH29]